MTSRFHNLPTAELVELERQSREDRRALLQIIRERFVQESGFELGKPYRIIAGRYAGRTMLLRYIVIGGGIPMIHVQESIYPVAEGPLNKGSGWNFKHMQTRLEHLEREPA